MEPEYLNVNDAARRLGVSVGFLNKLRIYGGGPRFIRFGRSVRYSMQALDEYVRSCEATQLGDRP
jgi:excisionase family DNA binding protein